MTNKHYEDRIEPRDMSAENLMFNELSRINRKLREGKALSYGDHENIATVLEIVEEKRNVKH